MEITPGNEQIWRAGTEVALAASLVIFLFTYLNLNRWHDHFSYGAVTWVLGLLALAGLPFSIRQWLPVLRASRWR